jgi:anti-sigma B factor antagonist
MAKTEHRLDVSYVGDVSVVRFRDKKIMEDPSIQEIGRELFDLVERDNRKKVLLDFSGVSFMSSAALGKLVTLFKKSHSNGSDLKLCGIRAEVIDIFSVTRLDRLFDIRANESDGLVAFEASSSVA